MVENLLEQKEQKRVYFSFGPEEKEGFEKYSCLDTSRFNDNSIDEIAGSFVLERVFDLVAFIKEMHRILKPGAKAIFCSTYFAASEAYTDPRNLRKLSEFSLNFASKKWREANKFDLEIDFDFEVLTGLAVDPFFQLRSTEVQQWAMFRHLNGAKTVHFTLTKN